MDGVKGCAVVWKRRRSKICVKSVGMRWTSTKPDIANVWRLVRSHMVDRLGPSPLTILILIVFARLIDLYAVPVMFTSSLSKASNLDPQKSF